MELDEAAPREQPEQQPDGVDRDVDRRGVAAADERLVQLVADGVEDAERERRRFAARARARAGTRGSRTRSRARTCAGSGPTSRGPVPRLGIDESAKISAAQSDDGQPVRERARVRHRHDARFSRTTEASGWGTPVQIRDGPAAVRGDASAPTRHWPPGWEGGTGGRPESEDLPFAANSNPSRKGGFGDYAGSLPSFVAALVVVPSAAAARVHVRVEGKTHDALRRDRAARQRAGERARRARGRVRSPASSTTTSSRRRSGRTSTRSARYAGAGQTGWVFKVNGKSPPVGADAVSLKDGDTVLWYWAQFGDRRRAEDARARACARAEGLLPRLRGGRQRRRARPRSARCCTSDAARTVQTQGSTQAAVGCVGKHRGLVRATLAGAVRSNALA